MLALVGPAALAQERPEPDRAARLERPGESLPDVDQASPRSAPAARAATATIAGKVVAADTGDPLEGISVRATVDGFGSPFILVTATTAADGTYSMAVEPGQYRVEFFSDGAYPGEWFDDQPTFDAAHAVAAFDGATATVDAALAMGTPVSGTVVDGSGAGVPASVSVAPVDQGRTRFTVAAPDGTFSFAGLLPGTYDFRFRFGEFAGTTVEGVVVGSSPATVSAVMAGGVLEGTVTGPTGAAVEGARVTVMDGLRAFVITVNTNAAGAYRIAGLEPGSYFLRFVKDNQEEWLGSRTFASSDLAMVSDGAATVADHRFGATGVVAGRVTSAADGSPVAGVEVGVGRPDSFCCTATAITGADGTYTIAGLSPGAYTAETFGKGFFVGAEFADLVTVTAGATSTADFAVAPGGSIRGTLVDRATGGTVFASFVEAEGPLFNGVESAFGFGGEYVLEGLPPGVYRLLDFFAGGVFPTVWHDAKRDFNEADLVTVTAGTETALTSTVDVGDAALTGRVVDAATGEGIPGAAVSVLNGPFFLWNETARTAGDGTFALRGIPAGEHRVRASHPDYASLFLGTAPTTDAQLAGTVTFTAGAVTTVEAALTPNAQVSGVVTRAADGSRATEACVTFVDQHGRATQFFNRRNSGAFEASIAPGDYKVRFANCFDDFDSLATSWVGGSSEATATVLRLTPGQQLELNAALGAGGSISGRVTDAASGAPLEGMCVNAFEVGSRTVNPQRTETDEAGNYRVSNLGAGEYHVRVFDCRAEPGYIVSWFGGSMSRTSAASVAVPAGGTAARKDVAMRRGDVTIQVRGPGQAISTGTDTTAADPVATSFVSPNLTLFSLGEGSSPEPIAGYDLFAAQVGSSENLVHPERPYEVTVELDASLVGAAAPGRIVVFHEGMPLASCGAAPPSPACVVSVAAQPDGDVVVTARATFFGDWRFGTPSPQGVGLFDPVSGRWYLRPASGGPAVSFVFGNPGDVPLFGDWDCDGVATAGVYRTDTGQVHLRNSNSGGVADASYPLGNPGDVPLAGDFDGDRCDTVSIYRPATQQVHVFDGLSNGSPAKVFVFGNPDDVPFVGDFDGDGIDTVGLHRPSDGRVYFRNSLSAGNADAEFLYGNPGDRFVAGDWNGDGVDSPGVFRPADATFYLRNVNQAGIADTAFPFGDPPWLPVAGFTGL